MATPAENEERERVRKAHENVERWKQKYAGAGGFSGGFRVVAETNEGVIFNTSQTIGNLSTGRQIVESIEKSTKALATEYSNLRKEIDQNLYKERQPSDQKIADTFGLKDEKLSTWRLRFRKFLFGENNQ